MKWFKHMTDSINDPDIYHLVDKFGGNGYLVFFGVLEIYAREFKPEVGWKLRVSLSYLKAKLSLTHYKLMLNILQSISELGRFQIEIKEGDISIFIPKFKDYLDEWTQRKCGSLSGVTPKILKDEVEVRSRSKKEIKDLTTLSRPQKSSALVFDFESIWKSYPLKLGKKEAIKHFNASVISEKDFEDIKTALVNYQKYIQTPNSRTQKLPPSQHGSTWFNNWRDWIEYKGLEIPKPIKKDTPPTPPEPPVSPEEEKLRIKRMNEALKAAGLGNIGNPAKVEASK